MTRYTESIRANANKTEKEQLVSLMEKFNISVDDAMDALTEELGGASPILISLMTPIGK